MRIVNHLAIRIACLSFAALWLWTQRGIYPSIIIGLSAIAIFAEFRNGNRRTVNSKSNSRALLLSCSLIDPLIVAILVPQLFVSPLIAGICIGGILLMLFSLRAGKESRGRESKILTNNPKAKPR